MKLRYKNYFLGLAFWGLTITYSCDQKLDLYPEDKLTDAVFWLNATHVRDACNYLYSFVPAIETNLTYENYADDGVPSGSFNQISDGSRLAPGGDTDWNSNYGLIRNCNNILEKSAGITGQAGVDRYRGEAYFFRAWANFELVKRFGDVPLILQTFDVFDTLTVAHRTNREIVLDAAYADLDNAIASLPDVSNLPAAEYGRVTSGAALALKARIGLFEGTRNKFHSKGDAAKHLNIAVNASETLMNSAKYALYKYTQNPDLSYYYLFQYQGEGSANKENIFVRLYGVNNTNNLSSHYFLASSQGGSCPTRALADAYRYVDGLPMDKSPYFKKQKTTLTEFENRDLRMEATIYNKKYNYTGGNWIPSFVFWKSGYSFRKYVIPEDYSIAKSFVDNIVMRYGEVLLTYAEAKFELNGSISDADLNKSINLIRARAKMPALTNSFVTSNGLDMRTEIRTERRVELAMEGGHRYWDLIRWKMAETELPKSILGSKLFPKEQPNTAGLKLALTADSMVVVQDASKRSFDPGRDYLWPLPTTDLGLNPNLTQNPKW
ncbi:MAG: hypothetical protein A2W90_14405 [Bacteroidetes bacterium GWF2_42_66]|nr:MAG: hypothetical protein A2W92_15800 [Bacteroidetes bacterium GWA2_42_15]OFX99112.1 MAG: hypothetical protein A2W89_06855 [Bacteroidetes bacterium GWE2_42_39]OFY46719.1 MAG: hypothetical protein A2W90_14405 [Bacteroidetes bacterium GWF2_42_66]HAZ00664.1 RagB/SusD family nutrient uptake outer membrane protein [Marinilabiliales bacterium]HBL73876.1 RagB/SusD family nutrient uptake outer membrane protein [Prolixibacteraceae bacterium]